MKILALDLGTRTGWAYRDNPDALCSSGYADFKNGRFEGGGMRFLNFRRWLENNWTSPKPDVVYLEEVANHKGIAAAHVYGGLLAILTAWCEEHAIPYQGIPVGTIKKHLTGKGNAKKDKMIEAIQEKGYNFVVDDNEADAIAILICGVDS